MTPKPIFLSASEPDPARKPEYWDSRNLVNVREAVRALLGYVLPRQPLVFGGHPAITPLVLSIVERLRHDALAKGRTPQVLLYLSQQFAAHFADDIKSFADNEKEIVPALAPDGQRSAPRPDGRAMSLALMRHYMVGHPQTPPVVARLDPYRESFGRKRHQMFHTWDFAAGIFIGGMEGVEREFNIFRHFHPTTPAWPIASTGSACASLVDRLALPSSLVKQLRDETAYSLLMQQLLGGKPRVRRWPRPPRFSEDEHLDPPSIARSPNEPRPVLRRPG